MNRRQMIKTVGAGAGVAALGTGAVPPSRVSPVGESEAGLITVGAVAVGLVAAYGAGVATHKYLLDEGADVDTSTLIENEVHSNASGVAGQRERNRQEITDLWIDAPVDETPFADASWENFTTAAALEIVNGNGPEAEQAAYTAHDKQSARAYYNAIQDWNAAIIGGEEADGLIGALVLAQSDPDDDRLGSTTQIVPGDSSTYNYPADPSNITSRDPSSTKITSSGEWEPVEASEIYDGNEFEEDPDSIEDAQEQHGIGEYAVWKREWKNEEHPIDLESVEGIETPVEIYGISSNGNGNDILIAPSGYNFLNDYHEYVETGEIQVEHSSRPTVTPLAGGLYDGYFNSIDNTYDELQNNQIPDWVSLLKDSLEEGVISPTDVISPQSALNNFAKTPTQSRFTAEAVFSGMAAPSDYTFRAEVSHPDLVSDSKWGTLFVKFAGKEDPPNISAGTTLEPADYHSAVLGFVREDNGEYTRRGLSGKETLEILDVEETEDEEKRQPEEESAGENGEVLVWPDNGEVPDPIKLSDNYGDWSVVVGGGSGTKSRHKVSDIVEKEDGWYLDTTSLSNGELIEEIRLNPPIEYSQPTRFWTDKGTVNEEQIRARVTTTEIVRQEIEEALGGDDPIGGGFFDGGLPSLPGLGFIESVIVVILAIFGLNAASG